MGRSAGKDSQMGWALRTRHYRYIEWRQANLEADKPTFGGKALGVELYDYEKDPLERENLADRAGYAGVLKEHQALFDRLLPHLPKRER